MASTNIGFPLALKFIIIFSFTILTVRNKSFSIKTIVFTHCNYSINLPQNFTVFQKHKTFKPEY